MVVRLVADAAVQCDVCTQDCDAHRRMCQHGHMKRREAFKLSTPAVIGMRVQ